MKATIPFVLETIAKKDTEVRSKIKFVFIVGSEMWPARTPEDFQEVIIWCFVEEELKW